MDVIAYLICFTVVMINLFGRGNLEPISFGTALIGLGLCSIAGALNNFRNATEIHILKDRSDSK